MQADVYSQIFDNKDLESGCKKVIIFLLLIGILLGLGFAYLIYRFS